MFKALTCFLLLTIIITWANGLNIPLPETKSSNAICFDKEDGTVSYVSGSCTQIVICNAGSDIILNCPNGMHYNLKTKQCDYSENVDCPWASKKITGPSGITCAQPGKCRGQPDGTVFADPNSNGYIVCQCECDIVRPCPKGTKFDENLQTCNHVNGSTGGGSGNGNCVVNTPLPITGPSGVTCAQPGKCRDKPDGTLFADPNSNGYIVCQCECDIERPCPTGTKFNENLKTCAHNDGSDNGSNVGGNGNDNENCEENGSENSPSTGPSGIACSSGGRCVGQNDGKFFPSLNSCSKYVICQCECEVEMNCPKNLLWDNALSTCNYAANVTCTLNKK